MWGINHHGEFHIYGDATGKGRSAAASGKSSYYWVLASCVPIRGRIKLRVPDSNPSVVDRINAVNYSCRHEDGTHPLLIDPRCPELIADMEQVLRDSTGGIKKTTKRTNPYFFRTHYSDALGYWVASEAPVAVTRPGRVSLPRISSTGAGIKSPQYVNASA